MNANNEIRMCPTCRLRFEVNKAQAITEDCYRCMAPTIGTGITFEIACRVALDRLRSMKNRPPGHDGLNRPYRVLTHDVYLVETDGCTHLFHFVELER